MKVLTSTLDHQLERLYEEFFVEFGFGSCGAYAALRREQGWGAVAVCMANWETGDKWTAFSHYVLIDDGLIDLTNPLGEPLTYHDIEVLDDDEMPELCGDGQAIEWLRARLSPPLTNERRQYEYQTNDSRDDAAT